MQNFVIIGFTLAATANLILLVLTRTIWRSRFGGLNLSFLLLANLLWALGAVLWHTEGGAAPWLFYMLAEILRDGLLLVLLIRLLNFVSNTQGQEALVSYPIKLVIGGVVTALTVMRIAQVGIESYGGTLERPIYIALLLLALIALMFTEKLYRYTRAEQRWAIKFLCLALAIVPLNDFYFYSEAVLVNRLNPTVEASRGFIATIAIPLLAISLARNPSWSSEMFISRHLVLRSFTIIFAGIYLLMMAAVGYWLRATNSEWGASLQLVFLAVAIILMVLALSSGRFQSQVKIFFNKHFFSSQFDYRSEWLRFNQTLGDAQAGRNFHEHAIRAMAEIVDSPGGRLWGRIANGRRTYLDHWSLTPESRAAMVLPDSLLRFLDDTHWVVDLDEFRDYPERYEGLELSGELLDNRQLWLVIPLVRLNKVEGVVTLAQPRARREIIWEDRDLLKAAGEQLASYLALYDATMNLLDNRQFDAYNRLAAFVVHDLKNVSAQLSLIATNADKYRDNPQFIEDSFDTVGNAVTRLETMVKRFGKEQDNRQVETSGPLVPIINELQESLRGELPELVVSSSIPDVDVIGDPEQLLSILTHLVQNAQEASEKPSVVELSAVAMQDEVVIKIKDSGRGMSQDFVRNRLFRPFDTTKGNAGMGIGVYQSRQTLREFGGDLTLWSKENEGTEVLVTLINN